MLTPCINLLPPPPLSPQVRVLVTHGIGFLSQCDRVASLKEGRIAEVGSYAELIDQDGPFAEFIRHHTGGPEVEEDLPGI